MKTFSQLLFDINKEPLNVLSPSIKKSQYVALDLSESNESLKSVNTSSSKELGDFIFNFIRLKNAKVAYGGYNEKRSIYNRSNYFKSDNKESERNIHLGLDLWIEAGSLIYAPLNGVIHSFKNNTNHGDYGPTLILEHIINELKFYTLYGHLSLDSISEITIGQTFLKGQKLAELGDSSVNGDYPPHLHFQVIKELQGFVGDYPGVSNKKDLPFYLKNCPDPNSILELN